MDWQSVCYIYILLAVCWINDEVNYSAYDIYNG